jgi:PhoPQ-activated pathogenicity-related protein
MLLQASARAMDSIQDFIEQETGNKVEKFMLAGESKVATLSLTA